MSHTLSRREFIARMLALSAAGALAGCIPKPSPVPATVAPTTAPTVPAIQPAASATSPPTEGAPLASHPAATATSPVTTAFPTTALPPTAVSAQPTPAPQAGFADLAVARGPGADPAELTRRAIAAVGGIERFVKRGATVVVKPNICNAYHGPEYASTTNPQVVAAIVTLCLGAGARRVIVLDYPFGGTPQAAYTRSGIEAAVKAAGGEMDAISRLKFRKIPIPQGKTINEWPVYGTVLDADVLINVPIAKDHGTTRLTLGMKNLMGVVQDRNAFHARGIHQCIADLNSVVRPQLTVVDAVRILVANGPTGGNLNDVQRLDTVIASPDVVAADSYAATLFGLQGADIGYIKAGAAMGLGQMDLGKIKIEEITA